MTEKIIFKGRVYGNVAEMPSNVRQEYERIDRFFKDENQDGIPDIIQERNLQGLKEIYTFAKEISKNSRAGNNLAPETFNIIRISDNEIFVNGKVFKNVEVMPPDVRKTYEKTIQSVNSDTQDIFNESWRTTKREDYFTPHDDEIDFRPSSASPSTIQEVNSNSAFIIILIALIILCAGAFVWLKMNGIL